MFDSAKPAIRQRERTADRDVRGRLPVERDFGGDARRFGCF